jgi:hypothetical protein
VPSQPVPLQDAVLTGEAIRQLVADLIHSLHSSNKERDTKLCYLKQSMIGCHLRAGVLGTIGWVGNVRVLAETQTGWWACTQASSAQNDRAKTLGPSLMSAPTHASLELIAALAAKWCMLNHASNAQPKACKTAYVSLELVAVLGATVSVWHAEPAPGADGAALSGHCCITSGTSVETTNTRHVPKPAPAVSPARQCV